MLIFDGPVAFWLANFYILLYLWKVSFSFYCFWPVEDWGLSRIQLFYFAFTFCASPRGMFDSLAFISTILNFLSNSAYKPATLSFYCPSSFILSL